MTYALRLGDDALVYSQRLAEWITSAPELEEDVALANIALDVLGQARALLSYAGQVEGAGRDEDTLAYFRDERDFLNAQIFELEIGDFAFTIARMLVVSAYQVRLYDALSTSADPTLAAIATKAGKEVRYHRDHAEQWTLRLGDGTRESHERMQRGIDAIWPYAAELYESDELTKRLDACGIGVEPSGLEADATSDVARVLDEATLARPEPGTRPTGGRRGVHTESFGYLIATMQHLARSHPGATW